MKRIVCIMFLVTALVSANVWALTCWNPDGDPDFKFDMDFETHVSDSCTPGPYDPCICKDLISGTVARITDFNDRHKFDPCYPVKWDVNSFWNTTDAIRGGICADFGHKNDHLWWGRSPNDVNLIMGQWNVAHNELAVFDLGSSTTDKQSFAFWFNDFDINEPGQADPNPPDPNYPRSVDEVNTPGYLFQRRLGESTIIRYAYKLQQRLGLDEDKWWEIRINNGRMEFREGRGHIFIQTAKSLSELGAVGVKDKNGWARPDSNGVDPNTWHHAIIALDRTSKTASKIYIDGIEAPITVIGYKSPVSSTFDTAHKSCVQIGAGKKSGTKLFGYEFDGMLDEIRIYRKALAPTEASILYQWDSDDPNAPIALLPYVNARGIAMSTNLDWDPATDPNDTGVTKQEIYFGTDPDNFGAAKKTYNNGTGHGVANSELNKVGGVSKLLSPNTRYYWQIKTTTTEGMVYWSAIWTFLTESGKAFNPIPSDGAVDINNIGTTDLYWTTTVTGAGNRSYDVYFSSDPDLVEANDPGSTHIVDDTTGNQALGVDTSIPGMVYYWRINTNYLTTSPAVTVPGDIWQFRTEPYKLVFNSGPGDVNYLDQGHIIPSLECHKKVGSGKNDWDDANNPIMTGTIDANCGVAVFTQTAPDFNYDSQFDIVVVPDYFADDIGNNDDVNGVPTPLAIHVAGDFYFDGMANISGDNSYQFDSHTSPKARCGGHRGARQEENPGDFKPELTLGYYYKKVEFESRWGDQRNHYYSVPTITNNVNAAKPSGYDVFGLGCSKTAPYKDSGGAGYGGVGGDSGRGWTHGIFMGGVSYGDEEVPVPFGGSAASWSQHNSGGAGGGGIEIFAANVTFGEHAKIYSKGGTHTWVAAQYPSGGGSGGSVKIVTPGDFNNMGIINVSGGRGQDGGEKGNNTGGGGAGGRVAVFYGGDCFPDANGGNIVAAGGDGGIIVGSGGSYSHHNGLGMATGGDDGTIYVRSYAQANPVKASAPTPKDGDKMVYDDGSHQVTLKWYSGFGAATDRVYFGEVGGPNTTLGNLVSPATRGQHTCDVNATVEPNHSYYWYVKTDGAVKSDVWEFSVVDWECLEPDWESYAGEKLDLDDADMMMAAGWPAWDQNHDCIVNNEDLWYMAEHYQENRGGWEYRVTKTRFEMFVYQWMTCRARTNNGCDRHEWQPCGDWIPPGDTGL